MADLYLRKLDPELSSIQINVHVTREFRFRIWFAIQLIRLAGRVLGSTVDVTHG